MSQTERQGWIGLFLITLIIAWSAYAHAWFICGFALGFLAGLLVCIFSIGITRFGHVMDDVIATKREKRHD